MSATLESIETVGGETMQFAPSTQDQATEPTGARLLVVEWEKTPLYRTRIHLAPQAEGGFSVYAPELPGAVSEGESIEEAKANIREALSSLVESYIATEGNIPWTDPVPEPEEGEILSWVWFRA